MRMGWRGWELAPAAVAIFLAAGLGTTALLFPGALDARLAYLGGAEAWRSGHPENLFTWNQVPFLGLVMALATRVASVDAYATALNLFNIAVAVTLIAAVWARLRGRMDRRLWWATLILAIAFAPLSSTLWWKQLNLVVLALAIAGWELLRRRREIGGASLIALSLSIKPLFLLLPLALLLRKDGRRPGFLVLGWTAFFQAVALAFLAWRARDLAVLSPLQALVNFTSKSDAENSACNVQNFSPTSMLCRLVHGRELWPLQRLAVLAFVAALVFLAWRALGDRPVRSWHVLAFAAVLSPLLSPISWSHYSLLLAPLLLLVAVELTAGRDAAPTWILLGLAYLLAEMSWTPVGTIADVATRLGLLAPTSLRVYGILLTGASFAQYFLLVAAIRFFDRPERDRGNPPQALLVENPS